MTYREWADTYFELAQRQKERKKYYQSLMENCKPNEVAYYNSLISVCNAQYLDLIYVANILAKRGNKEV